MRMRLALLGCIATTVLCLPNAAAAKTIPVTTSADVSGSACTLRFAIAAANTNAPAGVCPAGEAAGTDTIVFEVPSGSTITLGSALPPLNSNIALQGPGAAALAVSGNNAFRVLEVGGGSTASTISGLTIANGRCGEGCGVLNTGTVSLENVVVSANTAIAEGGTNTFPEGGGILNNGGTMVLTGSTVSGNATIGKNGSSQNSPAGGGIYNNGPLTIEHSTLSANTVIAIAAGAGTTNAAGAAINNFKELTIRRSTIAGNSASASGSASNNSAAGGGISDANAAAVKVTIDRSTIAANTVTASGTNPQSVAGGLAVNGSVFTVTSSTIAGNSALQGANMTGGAVAQLKNTIVADPKVGPNCSATVTSLGFNLESAGSCGFNQATDKPSTNPGFAAAGLAGNGGPTQTIALETGSAAIDQGVASAGEGDDQRGLTRPVLVPGVVKAPTGDGTDIGAYEVQLPPKPDPTPPPAAASIPAAPIPAADTTAPTVRIGKLAKKTFKRFLKIGFSANEAGSSFKCRLDGKALAACSPPFKTKKLAYGRHRFEVIATDAAGNRTKPAKKSFAVKRKPKAR